MTIKIGHNQNPANDMVLKEYINPILDWYNKNNKNKKYKDWNMFGVSATFRMLEDLKNKLEEGFDEER
jgi:hypothetical protein